MRLRKQGTVAVLLKFRNISSVVLQIFRGTARHRKDIILCR
jgi:hypothetical protein